MKGCFLNYILLQCPSVLLPLYYHLFHSLYDPIFQSIQPRLSPSISPCFLLPINFPPHFIHCSSSAPLSLLFSCSLLPWPLLRNSYFLVLLSPMPFYHLPPLLFTFNSALISTQLIQHYLCSPFPLS